MTWRIWEKFPKEMGVHERDPDVYRPMLEEEKPLTVEEMIEEQRLNDAKKIVRIQTCREVSVARQFQAEVTENAFKD